MPSDIFVILWFFVPAAFANMAPIIAARLPYIQNWKAPMDFGATFRGKPLLGKNKTWRGLVSGALAAILVLWLQQYLVANISWLADWTAQVDYSALPIVLLGFLFAVGTLGGDAVKSFIKRQVGVAPGKPWPFFDQIGEFLGSVLITLPFVDFSLAQYLWIMVFWVIIDLAISGLGYLMGWKERPI